MKSRIGEKIKLTSYNDLLGIGSEENSIEVELSRILPFKNHPFKVNDDEKMEDLVRSIRENGVLSPILVRPSGMDKFETISGHRRVYACSKAGMRTIPAIIREMSDEEATIAMVDANIQREELLPSERAFAYRMKMEAMTRQGIRSDLTSGQKVQKLSREEIGQSAGLSGRQVNRYIRLAELIPDLLKMVDNKRIPVSLGVEISYIPKQIQKWISEYIHDNGFVKKQQIDQLRWELERRPIEQEELIDLFNEMVKSSERAGRITLPESKLKKYFPQSYSNKDIEETIWGLLESWLQNNKAGVNR